MLSLKFQKDIPNERNALNRTDNSPCQKLATKIKAFHKEYARGQREGRNRFRPADVAFFSSESDKNIALIFRKVRC